MAKSTQVKAFKGPVLDRPRVVMTERLTVMATKELKAFLGKEARREGISVAELVRNRCRQDPGSDEASLVQITRQLRQSVSEAEFSLKAGLDEAEAVLRELKAKRSAAV